MSRLLCTAPLRLGIIVGSVLASVGGVFVVACSADDAPVSPTDDDGGRRYATFPDATVKETGALDAGAEARAPCRGSQDTSNLRCDDFDDGTTDLVARGWTVPPTSDGGTQPQIITPASGAQTTPRALESVTNPVSPDAGSGDGGLNTDVLPRSILTDEVSVTKSVSTLEADIYVAEWTRGAYRVLRFDFGPTPQDLTGLTLDVMNDGTWRCVGYGLQAIGKTLKVGEWHHVRLVASSESANLRARCQVDDVTTAEILGQRPTSTTRRLEIGVTTYATDTPRTRVLYDTIDFHAD